MTIWLLMCCIAAAGFLAGYLYGLKEAKDERELLAHCVAECIMDAASGTPAKEAAQPLLRKVH